MLSIFLRHKRAAALCVFLAVLTVACSVALYGLSAYVLSVSSLMPSIYAISASVVLIRLFGISKGAFRYLERLVSHKSVFTVLKDLRVSFFQKITGSRFYDYLSLDKRFTLIKFVQNVEGLQDVYLRSLLPFVSGLLVMAAGTAALYVFIGAYAVLFALLYACALVAVPLVLYLFVRGNYHRHAAQKERENLRFIGQTANIREIVLSNNVTYYRDRLFEEIAETESCYKGIEAARDAGAFLHDLIVQLCGICVLLAMSVLIGKGFDPVLAAAVFILAVAAFEGSASSVYLFEKLIEARYLHRSIFRELDQFQPENAAVSRLSGGAQSIELAGVSFRYVKTGRNILQGVSLSLERGKKIAVVGKSGGGKTTLQYIMQGLLEPDAGSVKVDGVDLCKLKPELRESLFSVAEQEVFLFDDTVRNNLLIANKDADDGRLEEALRLAGLRGELSLDARAGEGGNRLSGGQKRRLSIARMLLKDAPFYILDEPFANLDAKKEQEIFRNIMAHFDSECRNCGVLMITHKRAGLDLFDEVICLMK